MHIKPTEEKEVLVSKSLTVKPDRVWGSLQKADGAVGSYFNENISMGGKRKIGFGEMSEIVGHFYLFLQVCR